MNKYFACIGSRKATKDQINMQRIENRFKVAIKKGYTLKTGAAKGMDQIGAELYTKIGGKVILYLPWSSYETSWIKTLPQNQIRVEVLDTKNTAAIQSVKRFHPAYDKLTNGAIRLHARNFLIIEGCSIVLYWTKSGKPEGGTGQGLRIAESKNIPTSKIE